MSADPELVVGRRNSLRSTIAMSALVALILPGAGALIIPSVLADDPTQFGPFLWVAFWGCIPFLVRRAQRVHRIVGPDLVSTYHRREMVRPLADVVEVAPLQWRAADDRRAVARRDRLPPTVDGMAHEIPVVDIGPFLAGEDGTPAATAIEAAATEVGFFQVIGHGVPTNVLDDVYAAAYAFSALPTATKEQFRSPHPYRGVHLRPDEHGAVRLERFLAARFDDADAAIAAGIDPALADYYHPNVWPTEPADFRRAVEALFAHTQVLGGALMRLFGIALGIGVDGFDGQIEPNASSFAINHYPARQGAVAAPSADGQPELLFHEHSDGNALTVLHQRGQFEGLQVNRLDAPGEWIPVPVRDDAFVINVGRLMSRWTNDHWPATLHRVVASPDPMLQRTTLTTFHMPALHTTIAPISRFVDEHGPRYEALTTYESEKSSIKSYTQPRQDGLVVDPAVVQFAAGTK